MIMKKVLGSIGIAAVLIMSGCDDEIILPPQDSAPGEHTAGDSLPGEGGHADSSQGDGKAGDGNAGDGKTGDAKTGDSKAGDGKAGDGKTGDAKTGDAKTGDAKIGDAITGDTKTGDAKTGDAKTGDAKTGDANTGDSTSGDASISDAAAADAFWIADGSNPTNQPPCRGKIYQCADGKDNDNDKLVDALDPECTGPCDNDEGSFSLKIPGVNVDTCKHDCYWDYDSGNGNDDCDWSYKCDPKNPGSKLKPYVCKYDPTYKKCPTAQSATCLKICLPITPNGCDCFGCCEIFINGKKYKETIYLGSGPTCTIKTPQNCVACTQVTQCLNTCGPCELCLGKTPKDLPAWCFGPKKDSGPPDAQSGDASTKDGAPTPGDAVAKDTSAPGDSVAKDTSAPGDSVTKDTAAPGDAAKDAAPGDTSSSSPDSSTVIYWWLCPGSAIPCLTNAHCPSTYYCITGCCQQLLK